MRRTALVIVVCCAGWQAAHTARAQAPQVPAAVGKAVNIAGVVKNATLRKYRRHSILGITIVVAVATPSNDPISLLALTIPLVLFYEATVWIGWVIQRRRARNPSHRLYDNRGTNAAK